MNPPPASGAAEARGSGAEHRPGGEERVNPEPEGAERFRAICLRNHIDVSDAQMRQLADYVRLLLDWNSRINLISRADIADVWRNQILHSIALLALHPMRDGLRCFDLGTGGGLPGIPLAILRPEVEFLLCDSIRKKIDAVESMRANLGLRNARTLRARGEEIAGSESFHRFDVVLARAVTDLAALVRIAPGLLAPPPEGILVCWKGGDLAAELSRARRIRNVAEIQVAPIALEGEEYFTRREKSLVTVRFRAEGG